MKNAETVQPVADGAHEYQYLSDDLPILVTNLSIEQSELCYMCSHFRTDFIWMRVMKGTVVMKIDVNEARVQEGECLFINSGRICEMLDVPEGTAELRVLIARTDTLRNPLVEKKLRPMINDPDFSSTVIRPSNPLFFADMDAMFDLVHHRPQEYEFQLLSHYLAQLRQILRIYHHTNPDETVSQDGDLTALREMMAFIGENYREELTVDQIAEAGKVSRSKCTRLFRTYIKKSPIHHLHSYRLERSVYLLNNTDLSISEIAYRCGFNQQSYYNRLFMRHFGMTPKEMRASEIREDETA